MTNLVSKVKLCPTDVSYEQCDGTTITDTLLGKVAIAGVVYTKKCPGEMSIDPEVVCVTNDGGLTISKAVAVFDTSVNPPVVALYDFSNTLLSGYTVTQCDDIEYDIEKGGDFCLNGSLITRYDVVNNETKLVESSYWVDILGVPQATPTPASLSSRPCGSSNPLSIGSQSLTVSGLTTLTPTAGSKYAVISIITGEVWITVDGSTPTVGASHPAYEGQTVYLQVENEILDFQCTGTATLFVTYYDKPLLLSQQ